MPVQRRLPKRGFNNIFRKDVVAVNIERLNAFDDGAVVDMDLLVASGIVRKKGAGVKILGQGELTKKLTVRVHAVSKSALEKIEKAGGTYEKV
jgi:large subunit ribosomal protein L15